MSTWMDAMLRGDFGAAWEVSDAVLRDRGGRPCWELPRHLQWIWNGEPLDAKRVLIRCYHGLGDTLQFIRYAPLVRARAAHVTVWAPAALLPLLEEMPGIDRLEALHDGAYEGEYDIDVEVMELPHLFRTTVDTIPADVPYLHAEPLQLLRDGKLAVGVVWRAGEWDERRSVPFEVMEQLAAVEGARLYVLQRDVAPNEEHPRFRRLVAANTIEGTARAMRALDLVITVDSMTAHLAGALGVPVWTLLPTQCDWRWMADRGDSPWYPTMRLFRQSSGQQWLPVLASVTAELRRLVVQNGSSALHGGTPAAETFVKTTDTAPSVIRRNR
jgi:hypothetical protein